MDFGKGGSDPVGTSVSTQQQAPWSGQQPYLKAGFSRARSDVLDDPTGPFPTSTVVPFAPQTEMALQATQNRALAGSPVQAAGNQAYLDTVQGNYLMEGNPYLQQAMDAANQGTVRNFQTAVQPGIAAQFSDAGRYGSGQHFNTMQGAQEALAGQIANTNAGMAYSNYAAERGRQQQAAAGAPEFAQGDYLDMGRLADVGQAYEGRAGAQLQDEINRYYESENAKKKALADYMALVAGGNFGASTQTQQPIYSSGQGGLSGILGAGSLALDAYKSGLFS